MKVTIIIEDQPNGAARLQAHFDPPSSVVGETMTQAEQIAACMLEAVKRKAVGFKETARVTRDV